MTAEHTNVVAMPTAGELYDDDDWSALMATADEPSRAARLDAEVDRQRNRELAAEILRRERLDAAGAPELVLLTDFLAEPDEVKQYRVEGLWPVGGRVVLAAQYKAGKTTLRDNLVRALVDDELFLGQFEIHPPPGRVVIIDNEMDKGMLRRWLRDQGIVNTDRVAVLSLRGKVGTFDLLDPEVRARWAAKLRALDASVVVFDCLRPVLDALGLSEDKEVGRFLEAFATFLAEADVAEASLLHHMGHTGERSRGGSRLRDWPDVEWTLVREQTEDGEDDPSARRYFKAYGRDVSQPESMLAYDPATRHLSLAGGTRHDTKADRNVPAVLAYLKENDGATQTQIVTALKDVVDGGAKGAREAVLRARKTDQIDYQPGPHNSQRHFLPTSSVSSVSSVSKNTENPGGECFRVPIEEQETPPPHRGQSSQTKTGNTGTPTPTADAWAQVQS